MGLLVFLQLSSVFFQSQFFFRMPSIGVKDVDQQIFTVALAAFFKKSGKVTLPEWVDLVKTNVAKELAPFDEDWYYTRIASIARHIYVRSPVGVTTVCKIYGVRRNNGSAPSHWRAGSGSIGRKALQALEQLKLVEKDPNGGRRLTSQLYFTDRVKPHKEDVISIV